MKSSRASHVLTLLVGAGIGSLVGILCAPKSGEETCKFLTAKAKEGQGYARNRINELEKASQDFVMRNTETIARQARTVSAALQAGLEACQKRAESIGGGSRRFWS